MKKRSRRDAEAKIDELFKALMDLTLENIDSDDILRTMVGHIHNTNRMFNTLMDGVRELEKRQKEDPNEPLLKIPTEESREAILKALGGSKGHANSVRTDLQTYIFFMNSLINQIKDQTLDASPDPEDEEDSEVEDEGKF